MRDQLNDLALIKIYGKISLPSPLPLAQAPARVGEDIFTIGYPDVAVMGISAKLTKGVINSVTGVRNDPRIYQISATIQPGNSGGPLFNMRGEVMGVTTSKLDVNKIFQKSGYIPENVNYAIKAGYIKLLIDTVDIKGLATLDTKEKNRNLADVIDAVKSSIFIIYSGKVQEKTFAGTERKSLGRVLTSNQIIDHFNRYRDIKANKLSKAFSFSIDGNKAKRYCLDCGKWFDRGSVRYRMESNEICINWDLVTYPESGCFKLVQTDEITFELRSSPGDRVDISYSVDNHSLKN